MQTYTECYTETELYKTCKYILVQILCSGKCQCTVERIVFLPLYSQSEYVIIHTEWISCIRSGSSAGQPGSYRRADTNQSLALARSSDCAGCCVKSCVVFSVAAWDSLSNAAFCLAVFLCRRCRSSVPAEGSVLPFTFCHRLCLTAHSHHHVLLCLFH